MIEKKTTNDDPVSLAPVEWGDDALLRIEEDLDGLEETGEPGGDGSFETFIDQETELEEWEELIDSQWVKLIE
jgi:hypothetical protein